MQATEFSSKTNKVLNSTDHITLKFLNQRVEQLKRRFGVRFCQVHGKAMIVDTTAIEQHMLRVRRFISTFLAKNTLNADEFSLFLPSATGIDALERQGIRAHGKEDAHDFLGLLQQQCKEKVSLIMIVTAPHLRAFYKNSGQDLGFDYDENKNAWVNTSLFYARLVLCDNYIGWTSGSKMFLLIDNCSTHETRITMIRFAAPVSSLSK